MDETSTGKSFAEDHDLIFETEILKDNIYWNYGIQTTALTQLVHFDKTANHETYPTLKHHRQFYEHIYQEETHLAVLQYFT